MSNTINIPKEKLDSLRRHLQSAQEIFEGLGLGELNAPELSPSEIRDRKWEEIIDKKTNGKKN